MSNRPEPAPIGWLQIASLRSWVLSGDGSVAKGPSPRAKRRRAIDQERICSVACALGCPMAREPGIGAGCASARRRDRDTGCRIMSGSLERQSDPRRTSLLDGTGEAGSCIETARRRPSPFDLLHGFPWVRPQSATPRSSNCVPITRPHGISFDTGSGRVGRFPCPAPSVDRGRATPA